MASKAKATLEIIAEDKTGKALRTMERRFKSAAQKLKRAGTAMTAAITLPAVIFGASAFNEFREFEAQMAKVKAVSGAAGDEFKALEKNAESLGAATKFSASEVAGLQLEYSKLGFSAKEITKVTKATLALAQASGEDLADSAATAGATLRSFGIDASKTAKVTDIMALSFSSSGLDLEKWRESMKTAAPLAKAAGVEIEETAALLSVLADGAIHGSMAGTALKSVFNKIKEEGVPLQDTLEDLSKKNLTLADAQKLVGERGQAALLILTNNTDKIKGLTSQYENATGAAAGMAAIMDDTASGSLARLSSAFSALQIQVGGIIAKALVPIIDKIGPVLARFAEMDESFQIAIVAVIGLAAALGPVLIIFGSLVSGIGAVASVVGAVSFTPIILGVIAVGGVFAVLVRYWEEVKKAAVNFASFVGKSFDAWKDRNAETLAKIGAAWGSIKDSAVRIFTVIAEKIQEMVIWLDEALEPIGGLEGAWVIFGKMVSMVWDNITTVLGVGFEVIAKLFSNFADLLEGNKTAWEFFRDSITAILNGLKSVFTETFSGILKYLKTLPGKMAEAGKELMLGMARGIRDAALAPLNAIKEVGGGIIKSTKDLFGIKSPSRIFASIGRFMMGGLALGIAEGAPMANKAAESAAAKTIAAFEKTEQKGPGLSGPDFSGPLSGLGGFGDSMIQIPGSKDIDAERAKHDDKLARLRKEGLAETDLAKSIESDKTQALLQMRKMQVAGYGQSFNSILNLTEAFGGKQSGIMKGLLAVSKGFAIAESVIAIQVAVSKAMALGFPQNIPFIAAAVNQGASIISTIKGAAPSFLGGGYTGSGSRSGGVDGRGGFNAVLHPNETVTDHTKGDSAGGGGVVINMTINGDPSPSVVAQLREEISNFAMTKLANIHKRGGVRAAAVSSR